MGSELRYHSGRMLKIQLVNIGPYPVIKFWEMDHGPNVANYQDISLYLSLYSSVYILVTNKLNADEQKITLLSR